MWEYMSLYAVRDDRQEIFMVKNYPDRGAKTPEQDLLNGLGADGWELVAVVEAYGGAGSTINHQLYLKRQTRQLGEATTRLA